MMMINNHHVFNLVNTTKLFECNFKRTSFTVCTVMLYLLLLFRSLTLLYSSFSSALCAREMAVYGKKKFTFKIKCKMKFEMNGNETKDRDSGKRIATRVTEWTYQCRMEWVNEMEKTNEIHTHKNNNKHSILSMAICLNIYEKPHHVQTSNENDRTSVAYYLRKLCYSQCLFFFLFFFRYVYTIAHTGRHTHIHRCAQF